LLRLLWSEAVLSFMSMTGRDAMDVVPRSWSPLLRHSW
jgi:hypothetical protein